MDYYFNEKDALTNEEIDSLIARTEKQGFVSTVFASEERASQLAYYQEGDRMVSRLTNNPSQYNKGFPLPKPNSNGICDNFKSPLFMQSEDNECLQSFNLQSECANIMNPAYYATNLQVYSGKSTFFSQALNVTIDKIYKYNDLTKTYT